MSDEVHLLVLMHGMWGSPANLAEMLRIIREKYAADHVHNGVSLEVLVAQTNREKSTYDGVDWGAERIVEEVYTKIKDIEEDGRRKVVRFSAVGYSLGGLLARYLIGALHTQKFFQKVKPVNFTTFATPHFGLPAGAISLRERLFTYFGPKLLSRTGEHFYGKDIWSDTGKPLLEVMADKDYIFYQALLLFPHVHFYANAVLDRTVPFLTAALERSDPFMLHETNGIRLNFDERYMPILKSYHLPSSVPTRISLSFGSKEYLRHLGKKFVFKVPLPPVLQFRFPGNVVVILLLPILIPLFISLAFFRLSIDMKASRARIRLLEKDPAKAGVVVNALRSIGKELDDAVADIIDDSGFPVSHSSESSPVSSLSPPPDLVRKPNDATEPHTNITSQSTRSTSLQAVPSELLYEPQLTELQHKIIDSLNQIPQLQKHYAFIDKLPNTHATIISRDINRFDFHIRGQGVLRHWADGFEM